jgi:hypothetical protein
MVGLCYGPFGSARGSGAIILRRLRGHIAHHDWFAVSIDFLIVVVGVFVGIQASNWNQARITRQQAREYRAMLLSDLNTNVANLVSRKRYYAWVRSEALATRTALHRPSSELGEQFLIDAYQASQVQPWVLKRSTYDQIVSTGAMATLGNAQLRSQIANYYVGAEIGGANIASLPPYREILRRIMPYEVQERLRAVCNERVVADQDGTAHVEIPTNCTLHLDPATVAKAITQIHDWPGLELDLNRWLVDLDQKSLSVDALAKTADQLETELRRADP